MKPDTDKLEEPIVCGQTIRFMCFDCMAEFEITHEPLHKRNPDGIKTATVSYCPYCGGGMLEIQ